MENFKNIDKQPTLKRSLVNSFVFTSLPLIHGRDTGKFLPDKTMNETITQLEEIWSAAMKKMADKLSTEPDGQRIIDTFFTGSKILSIEGNQIKIVVSTKLAAKVIEDSYAADLKSFIDDMTGTDFHLSFVSKDEVAEEKTEAKKEVSFFPEAYLNPNFTFDNFVVGSSNNEPFQASVMIASTPGRMFNPLLLYSESGLGKTHLLHAIGNSIKEKYPSMRILCISAADFVDEYVQYATGSKEDNSLAKYFRDQVDVFLIDDIQYIVGKKKTMEMFFVVFQALVNKGRQIVMTSDQPPERLDGLDERLRTRFTQGLVLPIQRPDVDTSVRILRMKIKANGLDPDDFDDEVITFIASKFSKNVRELEGALNRLIFCTINLNPTKHITMDSAERALKSLSGAKEDKSALTEEKIIAKVADFYSLTPSQLTGKIRIARISMARHIAMYLIRYLLDAPFSKIGEAFGGKDHATVINGVKKVENSLKTDPDMAIAISELKRRLS